MSNKWRLPTIEELEAMYHQLYKKGLGDFMLSHYWSSSEDYYGYAWYQYFGDGYQGIKYKDDHKWVRLVRDLKEGDIGKGLVLFLDGRFFEIAEKDEGRMRWREAIERCNELDFYKEK